MGKRRKKGLLIDKHIRQLILYSTIIDIPYYQKLKDVLTKYEKIYESDFEDTGDFDTEVIKIIKYSIKEVAESAESEWYNKENNCDVVEDYNNNPIKCQLCNTNNKYIFYIVNRETRKELNVGSDCIMDFPSLNSINGKNVKQLKNIKVREVKKIKRINEFNTKFPDALEIIRSFQHSYDDILICIPYLNYKRIPEIIIEMKQIYNNYIKNKNRDIAFKEFEKLINEYSNIQKEIELHIEENKDKELICKKEILDWLKTNGKIDVIEKIARNDGIYNKETIEHITKNSFLESKRECVKKSLENTDFRIGDIVDGKIYFIYTNDSYSNDLIFYISNIEFMHFYGAKVIINKENIKNEDIRSKLKIEMNKNNFNSIIGKFDKVVKNLGYEIEYRESIDIVAYKNTRKKLYKEINFKIFISKNVNILFIEHNELKEKYKQIFSKIIWKDISEEKRYEVDESFLSRNPYS